MDEFRTLGFKVPNRGITLFTESGYLMIVKSFIDNKSWAVQRRLVNVYFKSQKCIDCRIFEKLDDINANVNSLRTEISETFNEKTSNDANFRIINKKGIDKMNEITESEQVENKLTEKRVLIEQLKTGKIWTNWVWHTTKDGKKTKRPLSKVNDPNTWITYAEAESNAEWNENNNIGVMFAKNRSGLALCGIDIDAHHVDTNPLSREIMDMFSDTYIERSPSGKGYHILFFSRLDKLPTEQEYKELYKQKNSELDIECYISGITNRYFTFTGKQTSRDSYVTDKTDTLIEFLDKYMKKSPSVNLEQGKLTERR